MLRVFWIFPIGKDLGEEEEILRKTLQGYLGAAVFFGKRIEIPKNAPRRGRQIEARGLIRALPDSPGYKLGICSEDIFVFGTNFVFGLASPSKMKAVISTHRLRSPDHPTYLTRVVKEGIHETGHLLGLSHCPDPNCVMFFSNTLFDTDRKGWRYCKYCEEKLKRKGIYVNPKFSFYWR